MAERALLEALENTLKTYDSPEKLAKTIDHTLLSPSAGIEKALQLIDEAHRYGFHCAMLSPYHILKTRTTALELGVNLCTVIGFPSGFQSLKAKQEELKTIIGLVDEIDIVANIQALIAGDVGVIQDELSDLIRFSKENGVKIVKVIVEAPLLDDNTLALAIKLVSEAGADYVKTSTGVYSKGGDPLTVLRVSHIAREYGLKVKAAGGIRNGVDALLALASGAHRLGTSSGVQVVKSFERLIG